MPPRARRLTESDRSVWAAYARMIAPLPERTPVEPAPAEVIEPGRIAAEQIPPPRAVVRVPKPRPAAVAVGDQPGGLDTATWQRLRGGKLATQRTLDLHGMTVQRAYQALGNFLHGAHAQQLRCVEIITGRGNGEIGGAIRRELPHWLNRADIRPLILGAAHPHPRNPGSVRVLLRRKR
jgi:DNA-nicking Smr family endonuclease